MNQSDFLDDPLSYINSMFSIANTLEEDARAILHYIDHIGCSCEMRTSVSVSIDVFLTMVYSLSVNDFVEEVTNNGFPTLRSRLNPDKIDELRMLAEAYLL